MELGTSQTQARPALAQRNHPLVSKYILPTLSHINMHIDALKTVF